MRCIYVHPYLLNLINGKATGTGILFYHHFKIVKSYNRPPKINVYGQVINKLDGFSKNPDIDDTDLYVLSVIFFVKQFLAGRRGTSN